MRTTIKDVLSSGNWIITKVMQGYNGRVRIDAKTRYHRADEQNIFSEWCNKKYADRLRMEYCGNKLEITHY